MAHEQESFSLEIGGLEEKEIILFISGRIALDNLRQFTSEIKRIAGQTAPSILKLDLSGIRYMDSSAGLALLQLRRETENRAIPFEMINMNENVKGIMDLVERATTNAAPSILVRKVPNILEQVGEASLRIIEDVIEVMTFVGELLIAVLRSLCRPRSVRWNDVLYYMKRAGVDGLPIVSLISILLGLIMAFMSSLQLKQFGANVYVASLVAIAMVKELGPIMTAIIVAGRSGSAFAAEIGTMMVNEEVDALVTAGFDPIRFLVIPKVFAAMVVVPMLTLYADVFAILGGLLVGITGLDLTVFTYLEQTRISITTFDVTTSLMKSLVFAMLISGIGCQRGLQVKGGAESVGESTTSAVVSAIFLIIVADSIFAVLLHYIRE